MKETPLLLRTFNDSHLGRAGHINIQHYAQLIGDASDRLLDELGLSGQRPCVAQEERIRFLAELNSGDEVIVLSRGYRLEPHGLEFFGEIRRPRDDRTVCVFQLTLIVWDIENNQAQLWEPLGSDVNSAVQSEISEIAVDFQGEVLNVYQSLEDSQEVDEHGVMTPRALWHVITEALWETQSGLGADQATLKRKGITGGATVFQLKHNRPILQGTKLSVETCVVGLSESSIRMRHRIRDAGASEGIFFDAFYVVTFFDREKGQRCSVYKVFPGRTFGSREWSR